MQRSVFSPSLYTCHRKRKYSEDGISLLSDDVLVSILLKVSTKEAVRSSILCRRWEHLWKSITSLNLDETERLKRLPDCNKHEYNLEMSRYERWVTRVLTSHQGRTIEELIIKFDLDNSYAHAIDRWIKIAIEKRVQKLELDLSTCLGCGQNKNYVFPHLNVSCDSITSLVLVAVDVTSEVLEYLLSTWPNLESLRVAWFGHPLNLQLKGKSLKLKYLDIYGAPVENIEICAPNLETFKYWGYNTSQPLKDVPSLVEVQLGGVYATYMLRNHFHFASYISQLKTLALFVLTDTLMNGQICLDGFPESQSLKQLKLTVEWLDCRGFSSFIKAFPSLERFTFVTSHDKYWRKIPIEELCQHRIKELEFVGFYGFENDIKFVTSFIRSAVSLEKITIKTGSASFLPHRPPLESKRSEEEKRVATKCALQLRTQLPAGTELLIL